MGGESFQYYTYEVDNSINFITNAETSTTFVRIKIKDYWSYDLEFIYCNNHLDYLSKDNDIYLEKI